MSSRYKILFMVELLHEFYKSKQCNDFHIIPSAATQQYLKNYRLLYKIVQNRLVVLARVNDEAAQIDQPFVAIDPGHKFVFYLQLERPAFMTVTNIDSGALSANRFWYTNIHQNKITASVDGNNVDFLNLTAILEDYDDAATYNPGHLVKDAAGQVFECIRHTVGGNNTGNPAFWTSRENFQFSSAKDMCLFVTGSHRYQVSAAATQFVVQVFGLDQATHQFTHQVWSQVIHITEPGTSVQPDLSTLPPARYLLQINSDAFPVYLDDTAVYGNYFGVVEIFNHLPNGNDFALLDIAGKTKDMLVGNVPSWLNFTIRFANRLAYWKYFTRFKGINAIDAAPDYDFIQTPVLPAPAEYFTSDRPIPLQESPFEFKLLLNVPVSPDPPLAPNPDANLSGMQSRDGPDYYFNIYLNY